MLRTAALIAVVACHSPPPPSSPVAQSTALPVARELTIQRGSFTLHATVHGDPATGIPLVALPGGPGLSAHYLDALVALATPAHAVVLVDPRGTGASGSPLGDWTFDDYSADLAAVLDAIKAPRAHVLGHSFAALYAIAFAASHRDRIASLVLVDSVPVTAAQLAEDFSAFPKRLAELQEQGLVARELPEPTADCTALMRAVAPVWYADPSWPTATELGHSTCRMIDRTPTLSTYDVTAQAARYTGRALVIVPERSVFGVMGSRIAASLTSARVETQRLAACGHMVFDECPAPTLAAIDAFLR